MRVEQWMTPDPVTVSPRTSVLNARRMMRLHGIRHLPVVVEDRVFGMLSDRDVLLRDADVAQALSVLQSDLLFGRSRAVEAVMRSPVHTARAAEPIGGAAQIMLDARVSGLPVVADGRLVGIITSSDCLRALRHRPAAGRRPDVVVDDPDWYKLVRMGPGDERPGRPLAEVPVTHIGDRRRSPADAPPTRPDVDCVPVLAGVAR